jgi:uncharacterized protein YndB with AHSA1/START domain
MPDTATVTLTRTIDAPAIRVFRAWTDPAIIRRWLAPHPYEVREASADTRLGGKYSIVVVGPEGDVHTTTGEYIEVSPHRRLMKSWFYDGPHGRDETPSVVTIDLSEVRPGVTELTLTHAKLREDDTREASAGWGLCLDKLAALFEPSSSKESKME